MEEQDAFDSLVAKMHEIAEVYQVELSKRLDALDGLIKFYSESLNQIVESVKSQDAKIDAEVAGISEYMRDLERSYEKVLKLEGETIKILQDMTKEQENAYKLYVAKMEEANLLIQKYNEDAIQFNRKVEEFNEHARKYNKIMGITQ